MAADGANVAVVTGASAGIGLSTALGLARAGMRVVIVGRNHARTEAAQRLITTRVPGAAIDVAIADFSSLAAVRALATEILARHDRIDVLVNNAGLISPGYAKSADGYELTIAVNHLAPFLLTNLLLERLQQSAPARIVAVASQAHRGARLDPATMTQPSDWTPLSAYGRSKLANILFIQALARRLDAQQVAVACLHPGMIATDIGNRAGSLAGLGWRLVKLFLPGPDQGAETSIFLATTGDPTPFHGMYVIGKSAAEPDLSACDERLAEDLWAVSARLVGL
jgi:NAD(P)-dependent dehydrogenase (short-subunit alcohol dehydrogenase family)